MNNKEIYFLIFLSLFSLINTQNLCPYKDIQNIFQYFIKGINPYKEEEIYKWEFIHCVNNYTNTTYLLRDKKINILMIMLVYSSVLQLI